MAALRRGQRRGAGGRDGGLDRRGAVPLEDGDHTAPAASQSARKRKQRLNVLGVTTIAAEIGIVSVNAALTQVNFRHSPLRRRLNPFN